MRTQKDMYLVKNNGVTAKLKEGQANHHLIKIFDKNHSFILYEGFDPDVAHKAWSLLSRLMT